MLIDFFYHLRQHKLPVSIPEHLTLLDALRANVMPPSLDEFYHLSKLALIKDETLYDRFDQAFGSFYQKLEAALPAGPERALDLHIFLDKCVLEVFASDGRVAMTRIVYPPLEDQAVALFAEGGAAHVDRLDAWRMKGIW